MSAPKLPEPWDYAYEWDGPFGTRKLSAAQYNGRKPDRSVPIYIADQMREMWRQGLEDAAKVLTQHQIPVGNSAAGELACEWTYEAIKECHAKILALAKEITP